MILKNPVIPGFYPDPSICRVDDDYYLATSSFEYFPGIPLFHSRDLVNWKQIGHCLTRESQLPLRMAGASGGLYAPTLRYHKGRFYMITTNVSSKGNFFVYTDDFYGEWSEPIWIENKYTGHDPDLFFDEDGRVYYSRFSWDSGILLYEIDLESGRLLTEGVSIWKGFEDRLPEAPHIYKINGMYYLMAAEGGTARGHMAVIGRSSSVYGQYTGCPHNPILSHRAVVCQPVTATGHGDLVEARDGSWWMVFLAIRQLVDDGYHTLGRETFLAPVTWTDDGWPVVNGGKPVTLEMEVAGLSPGQIPEQEPYRDDFDDSRLRHVWNYRFNPAARSVTLDEKKSCLTLKGLSNNLSNMKEICFVGRRQQHIDFTCSAMLEFKPEHDGEEAGLCVFMNEHHHYEISVSRIKGDKKLTVRRRIGDLEAVVYSSDISEDRVRFIIKGDKHSYHFGFSINEEDTTYAVQADARYLSTEVAGGFTGVYIGMFATGNGRPSRSPAHFDWFEYIPAGT